MFFLLLILAQFNTAYAVCEQHHCIAVVDAGSTGSRLHLYVYDLDSQQNPVEIHEFWSKKIKPGLATLEASQESINLYLNTLFADAPEQSMPVYFYATAGMRLLPQPKQQRYYQALRYWFDEQNQWTLAESRTITGTEEGLFGWLAVNYQLGRFDAVKTPVVSLMDMGGASVQVVFPVKNTEQIDPHDLVMVDVFGQHFQLFIHSFLGLGQTTVSQQFLDEPACFAKGYPLPSGLEGSGNASTCQHAVSKLVNRVHDVYHIVKTVLARNPTETWYAIGGVSSLADDKPFIFSNHQFTNQALLEQADHGICQQSWENLNQEYQNHEYLYGYCLFSAYYYALMVDGYGLKPTQPIEYASSGQGADWSLGVVLHRQ